MREYHKIETLYERDEKTKKIHPDYVLRNPVFGWLNAWQWTEKVDGTNIRLAWDHSAKRLTIGGRTENAQLPAKLVAYLDGKGLTERFTEVFPSTDAIVFGEGYGAGIQKGGIYRQDQSLIVFDVLVVGDDRDWWLSRENVEGIAASLGLDTVPYFGTMTLENAREMVKAGFKSRIPGATGMAEGLIGRPPETLYDKQGRRLIVKLKTRDFAPPFKKAAPVLDIPAPQAVKP